MDSVATKPAFIANPPNPKVPRIKLPKVIAANPNPVIDAPTPNIHLRPGYLE